MRGFRLNGWRRIGIVFSVLWAIVFGLWGAENIVANEGELERCLVLQPANSDEVNCRQLYAPQIIKTKYITLAVALTPIPIAWLLIYIVIRTIRWIRRGFQPAA
jgi:hypothetical protein